MKPQKALHLHLEEDKKKPKHIGHDYMVFEKHDGWYGYMDLPSGVIHSRAGREIPSLQEFSQQLQSRLPRTRGRLLFEIMIEGLEYDSFSELNGILNRKYEQVDDVYIQVHDFIPQFNVSIEAETRYKFAEEIVHRIDLPSVRLSPILSISSDPTQWRSSAEKVWEKGGEGVILKRLKAPYSPEKRNFDLMKIKEEVTLDLVVVDMVVGQGKYQGTLGALIVQEKNGNKHTVSGMTDAQRDVWWTNKSEIIGKVVEVKAMKKLKDGSLREPRFKAIRFDKNVDEID